MIKRIKRIYGVFKPFLDRINRHNLFAIAGQSAFFWILSAVPLAMFIVSMLQSLNISEDILRQFFSFFLNENATQYMLDFMSNMYDDTAGISLITIIATLWSAAKGVQAITNGLNRVHETYENRNWFFLRLRSMVYTVVLFLILLLTILLVVLGATIDGLIRDFIGDLPVVVGLLYNFRYVIIFVYLVVLFALIYRNLPNLPRKLRKKYGFRYQLPGAILCGISWYVLSFAIAVYVNNFNGFSIYGGLTRLAVIMVWLYFCIVCLMMGAEINQFYHSRIRGFYDWMRLRRRERKRARKERRRETARRKSRRQG